MLREGLQSSPRPFIFDPYEDTTTLNKEEGIFTTNCGNCAGQALFHYYDIRWYWRRISQIVTFNHIPDQTSRYKD